MEFIDIYTVQEASTFAWILFGVRVILLFVFAYVAIFSNNRTDKIYWTFLTSMFFILFVRYSFILFSSSKIRYEVRIDSTVAIQEVAKDWEVIEQKNDNIWVLERKDSNE